MVFLTLALDQSRQTWCLCKLMGVLKTVTPTLNDVFCKVRQLSKSIKYGLTRPLYKLQ